MDIDQFNRTFPALRAHGGDPAMVGRLCWFSDPEPHEGTMVHEGLFQIIGYQVNYALERCYRVKCVYYDGKEYDDKIGRVMPIGRCLLIGGPDDTPSV